MTTEELEAEIVMLRHELRMRDESLAASVGKEKELTRRNVSLVERIRYIEHVIKQTRDAIAELLTPDEHI